MFTTPIRDALGAIPAVDLALAYGVPREADDHEIAVAAVTLRAGRELTAREIGRALGGLEREQRPALVHVVDRIPVTTWFRPLTQGLRAAGIPQPGDGKQAWYLDASGEAYRPLTATARQRLYAVALRRSGERLARVQLDDAYGAGRRRVDAQLAQHALVEVVLDDLDAVRAGVEDVDRADLLELGGERRGRSRPARRPRRR